MKSKILITGFHRSGTTLLSDMIRKHKDVNHVFHESTLIHLPREQLFSAKTLLDHEMIQTKGALFRARNVERVHVQVKFNLEHDCWGNKMSFPGPFLLQEWNQPAETYLDTWLSYFSSQAKVVLIVRHPFDVFLSSKNRWANDPGHATNYGALTPDVLYRDWVGFHSILSKQNVLDSRFKIIRFEDLVTDPEHHLQEVFEHCELSDPERSTQDILKQHMVFFGTVNKSRAFAYKNAQPEPLCKMLEHMMEPLLNRYCYKTHDSFV